MHYLLPFFKWTDSTWLAEAIRASRFYFPIIETFHLLALTLLFGAILMLNLRLCGLVMKDLPIQQVRSDLAPFTFWSLIVILVSGYMLFSSEAMKCYCACSLRSPITLRCIAKRRSRIENQSAYGASLWL